MVVFSPENGRQGGVYQRNSRTWWCLPEFLGGHGGVFTSSVFLGGAPAVQHRPSANFPSLLPQFQGNQPFPRNQWSMTAGAMNAVVSRIYSYKACIPNKSLWQVYQRIPRGSGYPIPRRRCEKSIVMIILDLIPSSKKKPHAIASETLYTKMY